MPCDFRRLLAELETTYTVPDDPPALLDVTAEAIDFLDRQGPFSVARATFTTVEGEVWQGQVSGELSGNGCSTVANGSITLVVASDGTVQGSGTTTSGVYECANGATIPPQTIEYDITGQKTDRFTLDFEDGVHLASDPIASNRATLVQTTVGRVVVELTCLNLLDYYVESCIVQLDTRLCRVLNNNPEQPPKRPFASPVARETHAHTRPRRGKLSTVLKH